MANEALTRCVKSGDKSAEASALLVMSQACVQESKLRLAHRFGSRAQQLFAGNSDAGSQAQALTVVSYTASLLGMDGLALQSAKDGLALLEDLGAPRGRAFGFNYLGVAATWAKDFEGASGLLETSVWFARNDDKTAATSFQPLVNSCILEILRITHVRGPFSTREDCEVLDRLLRDAWSLARNGLTGALAEVAADVGLLLLNFASCFSACRARHTDDAFRYFNACSEASKRFASANWIHAVTCWAQLELALCVGDSEQAIRCARDMARVSARGECAQLGQLALSFETRLKARST